MFGVLAALLIVVPFVELFILIKVADQIGLLATIVTLILVSVAGAWLLGQQGAATWRRLRATLSRGEMPTEEATDGALILFGGALLLTPGFLTDVIGLFLLIPWTRALVRRSAKRLLGLLAFSRLGRLGKIGVVGSKGAKGAYEVRAERIRRERAGTTAPPPGSSEGSLPPELPPTSPFEPRPFDEDDSPGRG